MSAILIDHDVSFAVKWFGGDVADGTWGDPEIVASAWLHDLTIITANGGHFVRAILAHQKKHPCTRDACHDMCGLIVIPNHEFKAKNAIEAVRRKQGLRAGRAQLAVDDVGEFNLYSKYHVDGTTEVKRFPMCRYRDDSNMPAWYDGLKVVGNAVESEV